ncbi:MAG: hypothetical protein WD894_26310 [Pirellulales bacterium]
MIFAVPKKTGCLLFRACVTLRRILAARKRPVARRLRKAVVMVGICFTGTGDLAGEESSLPIADEIRSIRQLRTSIAAPAGELPPDLARLQFARIPVIHAASIGGRDWVGYAYFWQAPALCHRPLYFEEPNLERYGHSAGCALQPLVSAAHFFSAVPALPVKMALEHPHTCNYSLGHARPGGDVCWRRLW